MQRLVLLLHFTSSCLTLSVRFWTHGLHNNLINEFKKSPQHATDRFCKIFSNSCDAENLNKEFMAPCTNINCLSQELKSRVYTAAPKSKEWSCLLSQHDCGSMLYPHGLWCSAYWWPLFVHLYYML